MTQDKLFESTDTDLSLRVSVLARMGGAEFAMTPDAPARAAIAQDLALLGLRKVRFTGALSPQGRHDWLLMGMLGATAVQACVVTGEPVTTRIDTPVERRYLRDMPEPTEAETEIPEDDTLEPLPAQIDLGALLVETLSLALPDYPRAEGAVFETETPQDERPNPFAALAALKIPEPPRD